MTPEGPLVDLIAKIGSSGAGAVIGLALMPPVSIKDALRRSLVSVLAGVLCYPLSAEYMKFSRSWENDIGAIVLTSAVAWWVFGAIVRILELKKPKP
jgi:hypothetical protein